MLSSSRRFYGCAEVKVATRDYHGLRRLSIGMEFVGRHISFLIDYTTQ